MKCKDCPIMKYDGETYTCPAHMYRGFINMYTETECRAIEWYPKYLRDQIEILIKNIRQLEDIFADTSYFFTGHRDAEGYQKLMIDELKSVHAKYVNQYNLMCKESVRLQEELHRITGENYGKN